jgi:hypothetical protein
MPLKGRATKVFAFAKTLFHYPHPLTIELVPKLIDYALKRMVRKLCLRWNSPIL